MKRRVSSGTVSQTAARKAMKMTSLLSLENIYSPRDSSFLGPVLECICNFKQCLFCLSVLNRRENKSALLPLCKWSLSCILPVNAVTSFSPKETQTNYLAQVMQSHASSARDEHVHPAVTARTIMYSQGSGCYVRLLLWSLWCPSHLWSQLT